jgi:hypothetical protein
LHICYIILFFVATSVIHFWSNMSLYLSFFQLFLLQLNILFSNFYCCIVYPYELH